MAIWPILIQFIFRLTFGLALAMAVTPPRLVSAGFYRVHLWVLLGLNTFAALALYSERESFTYGSAVFSLAIALAGLSYAGSVVWLYEKTRMGLAVLGAAAFTALAAAWLAAPRDEASAAGLGAGLALLDLISSGLLLGFTAAAMFLGHWYLNTPTMQLAPLRRLVALMAAAIVARAALSAIGLGLHIGASETLAASFWIWLSFRWLTGLLGALLLALLAWRTLEVPNTQSATGILYAAVILAFIGELASQLLSVDALYPL